MQRTTLAALLLAALVPVSSFFGLLGTVRIQDWGIYGEVWGANLWGDLAFTGGTVAAACVVAVAMRRMRAGSPRMAASRILVAMPLSFLLHWAVYAVSWSLTNAAQSEGGFYRLDVAGFGDAWLFTLGWGWPGLVVCAVAVPPVAAWLQAREAPRAAPATASAG